MHFTFAWRYFKAKKSANAINIIAWVTIGVIAFATACQIMVLSVFNGFEDLVKSLYSSFYPDIKVIPAAGKTFTLTSTQLKNIKALAGIQAVSLIAEEKALLQNEDQQTIISLKGVDEYYSMVTGIAEKTIAGKFNIGSPASPGLIVGTGIQNAANIYLTDDATASSPLTIILPKKEKFSATKPMESLSQGTVNATGIFAIQQEFDNKYAITNIGFIKEQLGFAADEYSALELKLNNPALMNKVQEKLQQLLGNKYKVESKYEQNTSLYNTMRLEKWAIYGVLTLILIIAAFNMVSALTMLVLEKQKDISVLQSMGASRQMILKIFLSEGLLLSAIGAFAGILLALIVCLLQLKFHLFKLEGGSFLIDYFPVKLQSTDFLLVSFTVAVIAFAAAWFPAYKASGSVIALK